MLEFLNESFVLELVELEVWLNVVEYILKIDMFIVLEEE